MVGNSTIKLRLVLGDLNNLSVCAGDIGSAYQNSKTKEKVYIIASPEFGPKFAGKRLIIVKALYGLKTSAARFHEHLSSSLLQMGFRPSSADADMWLKDCKTQIEYIAGYVDDVLIWSKDPLKIMENWLIFIS